MEFSYVLVYQIGKNTIYEIPCIHKSPHNKRERVPGMHMALSFIKVEEPIPNQDPIGNLLDTKILIKLGLNFDLVGIEFQ